MRLSFLGTGTSGRTPRRGRSRRLESSLLISDHGTAVLIDVTAAQAKRVEHIDAILLTHGHRDAISGHRPCDGGGSCAAPHARSTST